MTDEPEPSAAPPARGRLLLGGAIFIGGWMTPLLVPWVASTDWPDGLKVPVSGALLLGIPELFMLLSVAVLGEPGFAYLKRRLLSALKRFGPPQRVSRARYRVGLVLFVLPLVFGFIAPYAAEWVPVYRSHPRGVALACDLVFLSSLFVLGGGFWDKISSLFQYDAEVHLPRR